MNPFALSILLSIALGTTCFGGPTRPVQSTTFDVQMPSGPAWDPLAAQGQWFKNPVNQTVHVKSWEFHDDDCALSIKGIVQDITFVGTESNIVAFTVLATVSNNLPSAHSLNVADNCHDESQSAVTGWYAGIMLGTRITAEFAVADMAMIPAISDQRSYYNDPVSPALGGRYFIEAINEHERAWYCWSPVASEQPEGDFQVPAWILGDIAPGATASVLMAFQITKDDGTQGFMTSQDYRHSVIRYSKEQQADLLYNRHTSLKISHWLDTLLIDYDGAITAPPGEYEGEPPEYEYASDASVFFDQALDLGDAPPPYPTMLFEDGARHVVVPGIHLGKLIDFEPDGQPHLEALGDDLSGINDEDGVEWADSMIRGSNATLRVEASTSGVLNAWIDFHQDGSWYEPLDQIAMDEPLSAGTNLLVVAVPHDAALGRTFARFRFSSQAGLTPVGLADDGEVEDYAVTIYQQGPSDSIVITNLTHDSVSNRVTIEWNGELPVIYETQHCDVLTSNPTWTAWGPWVDAAPYLQTNDVSGVTSRFFRLSAPFVAP